MKTLIIGGGNIDFDFALTFMREEAYDFVIAADRGMEFLRRADILPDWIVGDFDSVSPEILAWFEKKGCRCEDSGRRRIPLIWRSPC